MSPDEYRLYRNAAAMRELLERLVRADGQDGSPDDWRFAVSTLAYEARYLLRDIRDDAKPGHPDP